MSIEAIEIEKGNIPLKEHKNIPTKSFYVPNSEDFQVDLIGKTIRAREEPITVNNK